TQGTWYGCSSAARATRASTRSTVVFAKATTSSSERTAPSQRYTDSARGSRFTHAASRSSTRCLATEVALSRSGNVMYTERSSAMPDATPSARPAPRPARPRRPARRRRRRCRPGGPTLTTEALDSEADDGPRRRSAEVLPRPPRATVARPGRAASPEARRQGQPEADPRGPGAERPARQDAPPHLRSAAGDEPGARPPAGDERRLRLRDPRRRREGHLRPRRQARRRLGRRPRAVPAEPAQERGRQAHRRGGADHRAPQPAGRGDPRVRPRLRDPAARLTAAAGARAAHA